MAESTTPKPPKGSDEVRVTNCVTPRQPAPTPKTPPPVKK